MKVIGIKLLNRVGDDSDFVTFNIREVNYIDLYRPTDHSAKIPVYHTPHGSYMALSTIHDLAEGYKRFGFVRHGGSTIINERRIAEKIPVDRGTIVVFLCGNKVFVKKKF